MLCPSSTSLGWRGESSMRRSHRFRPPLQPPPSKYVRAPPPFCSYIDLPSGDSWMVIAGSSRGDLRRALDCGPYIIRAGRYIHNRRMRLARVRRGGGLCLAVKAENGWMETPTTLVEISAGAEPTPEGEPIPNPEFGPLLSDPCKIICIGRNYSEHAREMGNSDSPWPEVFLRLPTTVTGPFDEIKVPAVSDHVDYEGELAVVIGRGGRHISAADAHDAILGYTIVNDISVRDWQKRGQQFTPGKNFDGTLPVGPELVTADELDMSDLALETRLNG